MMTAVRMCTMLLCSALTLSAGAMSAGAVTDGPEIDVPPAMPRASTERMEGARAITVKGTEPIGFSVPSGNIACVMWPSLAWCYIARRSWRAPVPPTSPVPGVKPADVGYRGEVGLTGKGHFTYLEMSEYPWSFSSLEGDLWQKGRCRWYNPKLDVRAKAAGEPNGFPVAALAYGSSITLGQFRCDVNTKGVTCTNTKTKHGFWYAKEGYKLF